MVSVVPAPLVYMLLLVWLSCDSPVCMLSFFFAVLCRVKVTLIDTVVRVEHLPDSAEKGVALEIKIKR